MEAFFLCQKQARGALGKTNVADQIANAGSIGVVDDLSEFGYTRQGEGDQDGLGIWRWEFDDNDEFKRVTSVTPNLGRVTVESEWVDQLNPNYILIGLHPHKVLDAMDAGYSRMTLRKDVVLTIGGSDLDMERSDSFYWGQGRTNITVSKEEATPENKVTGKYSLKITLTAANGQMVGPPIRAVPGDQLIAWPCLRVEGGGPFTVRLYDFTHAQFFGDTQVYSGAEFAYLKLRGTVPTGCDFWQLYIGGTESGAIAWLDSVAARADDDAQFQLEDWIDESYKLPLIRRVQFKNSHLTNNQYPAPKRMFAGDMVLNTHYQVQVQHTQANRYVLDFEPTVSLDEDIFFLVTRQQRDEIEPWTNKTDTTTAPRGELVANLMVEICDLLLHETGNPIWLSQKLEWQQELGEEVAPRAEIAYQPRRIVSQIKT